MPFPPVYAIVAKLMTNLLLAAIRYPEFDPVIFRLGPLTVRWYGLAYFMAFILCYFALETLSKRRQLRLTREQISDLVIYLAAGVVVGGRAGWWLIYHRAPVEPEPWYEPVAIWSGGMSFHGGLIGVVLVVWFWSWRNLTSLLNIADNLALVTPIGLVLGRLANFINAELVGRPTDLPWGVMFPGEEFARHPSQLYEALLEGPLLLVLLWGTRRFTKAYDGRTAGLFVMLYSVFRFTVEFTREPDAQLGFIAMGWLTMGQLLSFILMLGGAAVWMLAHRRPAQQDILQQ